MTSRDCARKEQTNCVKSAPRDLILICRLRDSGHVKQQDDLLILLFLVVMNNALKTNFTISLQNIPKSYRFDENHTM